MQEFMGAMILDQERRDRAGEDLAMWSPARKRREEDAFYARYSPSPLRRLADAIGRVGRSTRACRAPCVGAASAVTGDNGNCPGVQPSRAAAGG